MTAPGATPLDQDEADDLIPGHITTRAELDAWEQANISEALPWLRRQREARTLLTVECLRELHRRMFGRTWSWAGQVRTTLKSIGVPADQIRPALVGLLADTQYWIEHGTYETDGIAVRFHHRLVAIHPFPNGNGRHARLMTNALLSALGAASFTWGARSASPSEVVRMAYLDSLRAADRGDVGPLAAFVRT